MTQGQSFLRRRKIRHSYGVRTRGSRARSAQNAELILSLRLRTILAPAQHTEQTVFCIKDSKWLSIATFIPRCVFPQDLVSLNEGSINSTGCPPTNVQGFLHRKDELCVKRALIFCLNVVLAVRTKCQSSRTNRHPSQKLDVIF